MYSLVEAMRVRKVNISNYLDGGTGGVNISPSRASFADPIQSATLLLRSVSTKMGRK